MKGFAFTLGLSTILDLVIVFLFTHPLVVTLLGAGTRRSCRRGTPASARSRGWRRSGLRPSAPPPRPTPARTASGRRGRVPSAKES